MKTYKLTGRQVQVPGFRVKGMRQQHWQRAGCTLGCRVNEGGGHTGAGQSGGGHRVSMEVNEQAAGGKWQESC